MFLIVMGMRRAWLRGRQNVHKRYLIHVAGFNLADARHVRTRHAQAGRERQNALLFFVQSDSTLAVAVILAIDGETAMLVIIAPEMP